MCCLFGILDYGGKLNRKEKTKILSVLSVTCEERGTDDLHQVGQLFDVPVSVVLGHFLHVALLPVYLLLILGLMVWMHEKMLRTIS